MNLTFVELESFAKGGDESYRALQNTLLDNPLVGEVITGAGNGVRKMRWADARRGQGKRGGLRVVYLLVESASIVYFLLVYDKNKVNDLTAEEKRLVAETAKYLKRQHAQDTDR